MYICGESVNLTGVSLRTYPRFFFNNVLSPGEFSKFLLKKCPVLFYTRHWNTLITSYYLFSQSGFWANFGFNTI